MEIQFGALANPLKMQLRGILPAYKLVIFDQDANAITRLAVRGLITSAEATKARKRLVKTIQDEIRRRAQFAGKA